MAKKQRYKTLTSEGPLFPSPYKYKGATLKGEKLSPLAEEMLFKASRFLGTDYEKEAFQKNGNMWFCLKPELSPTNQQLNFPEDFILILTRMKEVSDKEKENKKLRSKEEKLNEREEKERFKAKYGVCFVDGEPIAIGGYLVEDANWILTRGKDPRKFLWKYRVDPSEVVLNIVGTKPPVGWQGKVESSPKSVWVFKYQQLCGRGPKAMLLNKVVSFSKNTDIGKQMIGEKYDKAQNILTSWSKIESGINAGLKSKDSDILEAAVICYLIALTGIRIGNPRNTNLQTDTRGMSTLSVENITL